MIIDKKRVFLYSSILLLILAGVYFTTIVTGLGYVTRATTLATTGTAVVTVVGAQNPNYNGVNFTFTELANWTRGGGSELINFTINLTGSAGFNSTAEINITLPTGYSINTTDQYGITNATSLVNQAANWTINVTSSVVSAKPSIGNLSIGSVTNLWFAVYVTNGSEAVRNWTITIRDNSSALTTDSGFGLLTGIDGLPPRGNTTNVTDGTNLRTSFSGTQYLKYDTTSVNNGVNITLIVNDYNIDRVLLVYNGTGGSVNLTLIRNNLYTTNFTNKLAFSTTDGTNSTFNIQEDAFVGTGNSAKANLSDLGIRSSLTFTTAPGHVFRFNISNSTWGLGASDGTAFKYVFVVYDLYNNSEIINNSNAEYVIARDTAIPTVTLTAPSDTTIDINGPIKYTCSGSDTSSIASCSMVLTKPNGDTVTKTGCSEQTFTTTDTNGAGTNTVQCTVTDGVGRTASTSKTFSVSSATTSSGGGGGGGSGGGSSGTTAENPVTVKTGESVDAGTLSTTETFTSVAKEGTVTFTVASGSHSVKVLDVTTTSVTIEIASTPKQLTLNIGDTKEVDVNDDSKNDLSVTLKSITDGKADLVFKSLEVSVAPSGETGGAGVVTEEGAKSSNTWLWVALIVVVLVLAIWYFGRKKQ